MASDIIDFQSERGRHEALLGREDVLSKLDALLLGGSSRGWVLVKGGPGIGKSALLSEWLKRREDAKLPLPPHHFLRRGVEDWDQPEVVKRNLAAQVEALYPEQSDPEARPESRLRELLQRVSSKVLVPCGERLVLLVDGLDEVEGEADGANPLPRYLPHVLPPGVMVLCASRPTYPYLSWLEGREGVRPLDLDGEQWASSNKEVIRQYWTREAPRFTPPLTPAFVGEVVRRAEGNMLYSVKLAEWLRSRPKGEEQRAELLPRGLDELLTVSWASLMELPEELLAVVLAGLGVVAVAREALPLPILAEVAGWKGLKDGDRFLREVRSFLLEEPGHPSQERAWRPFHESFRSFILTRLGESREDWAQEVHRRLAEHLCQWPVKASDRGFRRSYALRHGVMHWLKAGERERARGLYTDVGYLEAKCALAGVFSVEEDLWSAAEEARGTDAECPRALLRAIRAESHWLRKEPKALTQLVYNRLRCMGWTESRIEEALLFAEGLPAFRLRYPVKLGGSERTLAGHEDGVWSCAVTADGRRVVSASFDGTLKVWEVETGRELVSLVGHRGRVWGCLVMPDGRVVSASDDGTLKVWDAETGRLLSSLVGHGDRVNACAAMPDGRHVVSASADETLRVWEVETGRVLVTLAGHGGGVNGCAVMPDGRRVVSASDDGTLRVWEVETGRVLATLVGHHDKVLGCAVMPDGQRVVSASWDATLKVWEVETGRELSTLYDSDEIGVNGCAVMPDGRVVSASDDETVKVWDVETGQVLVTLEGHGSYVWGCTVTPDGRRVVSASEDGTVKVWEVETGRGAMDSAAHGSRVNGCAVTPDGRRVVSVSSDETVKVWEVETGRLLARFDDHEAPVLSCAVTPDGRRVVSVSSDETVKVWEVDTQQVLASLVTYGDEVDGCEVTADQARVRSVSVNGILKLWEVGTGQELLSLDGWGCAITVEGRLFASTSMQGALQLWAMETGRELTMLEGLEIGEGGRAVSADGKRVVTASRDGTLKVWASDTGQELAVLKGHKGEVSDCAMLPDGQRMVSVSSDGTLKLWVLDQGQCLHTLHGAGAFLSVAATADVVCAGDSLGNVWFVEAQPSASKMKLPPARVLSSRSSGNVQRLKTLHEAPAQQMVERDVQGQHSEFQLVPRSARELVFISYSKKDEKWLKRLETHLAPLVRNGTLELWNDARIQAGAEWKTELENALARTKVAVLLVSADFLASDLIAQQELAPLLRAAEHEGLKLLWVPIGASLVEHSDLSRYEPMLDPSKPLNGLPRAQVEAALVKVCSEILRALNRKDAP